VGVNDQQLDHLPVAADLLQTSLRHQAQKRLTESTRHQ